MLFFEPMFLLFYLKQKKATECLSVAFAGSIQIKIV